MIEIAADTETIMWVVGAIIGAIGLVAQYRAEVLARQPNVDMAETNKRMDGLYDHVLAIVERLAKLEATIELTDVDREDKPESGKVAP